MTSPIEHIPVVGALQREECRAMHVVPQIVPLDLVRIAGSAASVAICGCVEPRQPYRIFIAECAVICVVCIVGIERPNRTPPARAPAGTVSRKSPWNDVRNLENKILGSLRTDAVARMHTSPGGVTSLPLPGPTGPRLPAILAVEDELHKTHFFCSQSPRTVLRAACNSNKGPMCLLRFGVCE